MMGKHSKSWVSSCFPSPPPPPHHRLQDGPPSTSCSCHEVAETTCTIGLLFVCCPFSAVCCCVKVTRWLVRHARNGGCCASEKRVMLGYSLFSDMETDVRCKNRNDIKNSKY
nr:hypothetical protein TEA_020939 [Ipomoea batatas]